MRSILCTSASADPDCRVAKPPEQGCFVFLQIDPREFVLPSILEQLARGGPIRMLGLAVAGWFRYLAGTDERGGALEIGLTLRDPLATR